MNKDARADGCTKESANTELANDGLLYIAAKLFVIGIICFVKLPLLKVKCETIPYNFFLIYHCCSLVPTTLALI